MVDQEDKPARTMLTSEGNFSRTTHIVKDKQTRRIRLLTPEEAERIQGFPTDHTKYCLIDGKKVEIQLRTIGMDFWSVLEYQLQYKKHHKKEKALKKELFSCAIDVRNMDQRMLDLRQSIENV